LSAGLSRQELALIEAREGKSRHWHLRNLAITAKAALDAMPHDPNATDMTAFSNAIAAYADAERGFEEAPKPPGTLDGTNGRDLAAKFRTLREKIEKKEARNTDFQDVVNYYNALVQWLNTSQNWRPPDRRTSPGGRSPQRNNFRLKRHFALNCCLSMIFSENR
jgi:hypothetical protein